MTLLSFCRLRIVRYSSLFKLNFLGCPGKTENLSSLTLHRNNSKAGEPFGGFHVDLSSYFETSEGIYWLSFLKYHLHLIFLAKSSKSLCKSASLINDGVGEKPKPFSKTLISVLDNIYFFTQIKYWVGRKRTLNAVTISLTLFHELL